MFLGQAVRNQEWCSFPSLISCTCYNPLPLPSPFGFGWRTVPRPFLPHPGTLCFRRCFLLPVGQSQFFHLGDAVIHVDSLELHSSPGGGTGTQMSSLIWTLLRSSRNTFPVCVDLLIFFFFPPQLLILFIPDCQLPSSHFSFAMNTQFSAQKKIFFSQNFSG